MGGLNPVVARNEPAGIEVAIELVPLVYQTTEQSYIGAEILLGVNWSTLGTVETYTRYQLYIAAMTDINPGMGKGPLGAGFLPIGTQT